MQVGWTFERGHSSEGGEVLIRASFTMGDAGSESTFSFVVPESVAIGMRNDLSQACSGLAVASTIQEATGQ